jgi:hypothetical protein
METMQTLRVIPFNALPQKTEEPPFGFLQFRADILNLNPEQKVL